MVDPLSILSSLDSLFAAAREEGQEAFPLEDDTPYTHSVDDDEDDEENAPASTLSPYDDPDAEG